MRLNRVLSIIIAIALLGLAPLLGAGSASAVTAEPLPKREIASSVTDKSNKLVFKGNVSPGHADKSVFVQKKNCKGDRCDWHKFKVAQTNDKGGFSVRITAPRDGYWYWRAKVKAHGGYGTSYSDVWRTYST